MNFVKLDTSLYPIVYLDYPNNCTDEIFIENYIKLSKKLIKLEPIDTKYSLVHNLTKASTSNILDYKKIAFTILEIARSVSHRINKNILILPENIPFIFKSFIPICLYFSPVKSYIFYNEYKANDCINNNLEIPK